MRDTGRFAKRLAGLRAAEGIYLKEIAGALHISIGTMSNYENGIHQPNLEMLCRLADFYEVSTDYLLGRDKNPGSGDYLEAEPDFTRQLRRIRNRLRNLSPKELKYLELALIFVEKHRIG
ncbi:MAG: helix-turn-helix domain-containing protein [Lachnospiraceae bacterium]|nr:helix-turn-helix domain-containing protein [Lachnospiraceae bacterium]MCM1231875.1 helix-turn-helix domain-containing protein [Ruminococcus flavefaciens]